MFGNKDGNLSLEPIHAAIDQRTTGHHARVVEEVPRGEIVGAIYDHIVRCHEIERVLSGNALSDRVNANAPSMPLADSTFADPMSALRCRSWR